MICATHSTRVPASNNSQKINSPIAVDFLKLIEAKPSTIYPLSTIFRDFHIIPAIFALATPLFIVILEFFLEPNKTYFSLMQQRNEFGIDFLKFALTQHLLYTHTARISFDSTGFTLSQSRRRARLRLISVVSPRPLCNLLHTR